MKDRSMTQTAAAVALLATVSAVGLTLGGCASTPPPKEQMAVAEAAVARASSTSTGESAPAQLSVANGKLASARAAFAREDYDGARRYAEQATLDAQVAELHAQTQRARKSAQETDDAARALREEINRKTGR